MSILSALGNLLKALFKKLVNFVKAFFKKLWPILLIIAVIYFAPVLAAWLTSIGAPSFIITAMEAVTTLTPWITDAVAWAWTGITEFSATSWATFAEMGWETELIIGAGIAAAAAPEETTALAEEVVTTVADVAAGVTGSIAGAIARSPLGILALGAGAFFLLGNKRDDSRIVLSSQGGPA